MKRAIAVLLALLLSACARGVPSPTPSPLTVTDALGREVTLPAPPQRIVVAGKATIMIVDALYLFPEGPQRLAAVGATAQGGDFLPIVDPNAAAKATLGADAGPEQIAAAGPDLVILKSYLREKLGAPVEALGIPVFYVSLETPEQYFAELHALGRLLGNEARAEEVIAFYRERTERSAGAGRRHPRRGETPGAGPSTFGQRRRDRLLRPARRLDADAAGPDERRTPGLDRRPGERLDGGYAGADRRLGPRPGLRD